MANYHRWRIAGGSFFFTAATASRRPILTTKIGRQAFHQALDEVKVLRPFEISAIVILPDHVHCIWTLPEGDGDFSWRWAAVKTRFTKKYLCQGGDEAPISESRRKKGERGVWQRRFWEHFIRNENDLKRCLDYLHYNPVKHGLVQNVNDWPYSSFRRFVLQGEYTEEWASEVELPYDSNLFGDLEFA